MPDGAWQTVDCHIGIGIQNFATALIGADKPTQGAIGATADGAQRESVFNQSAGSILANKSANPAVIGLGVGV